MPYSTPAYQQPQLGSTAASPYDSQGQQYGYVPGDMFQTASQAPQSGQLNGPGSPDDALLGGSNTPGMLGTGEYVAPAWNISSQAFNNPAGDQGQNWNNAMANMLGSTTSANGPSVGSTNTASLGNYGQYQQANRQQQGLANVYMAQAGGSGPSLANVTAQQQANQNYQQQLSMLQAGGSGNPAAAKYQAGQALGNTQQVASQQAVLGRTQEEMNALNQVGGIYSGMAGNGLTYGSAGTQNSQFNAEQANTMQQAQANQQAQQNTLNANQYNQYTSNLGQVNQSQLNANISQQQLGVQQQLGLDQVQQQAYASAAQRAASVSGGILSGLGGMLGM